ncbi:MAG: hypothetical protein H0W71_10080 [Sphingomonas sp.]|nr:hypothetical protein [Sphingomonas sp.]
MTASPSSPNMAAPFAWVHEYDGWSLLTRTRLTVAEKSEGWIEKPLYTATAASPDYYAVQTALSPHMASTTELMSAMSSIWPLIERLSAESADLRAELITVYEIARRNDARAIAAEARLAEAVKALKPFAQIAEHDIGADEADQDTYRPMRSNNRVPPVSVGDLRRALTF